MEEFIGGAIRFLCEAIAHVVGEILAELSLDKAWHALLRILGFGQGEAKILEPSPEALRARAVSTPPPPDCMGNDTH